MAKEKQNNKPNRPSETVDLFKELRNKIKEDVIASSRIPSIIEFVYDKKYLGLPFQNPAVIPYDIQELILKCFYRGSPGNENLELTQKDLDIIAKNDLNNPLNGALLDKWNSMERFIELVLVWGRRCLSENCEIVDPKTGKLWTLGELWNYGKTDLESWTFNEETSLMNIIGDCNLVYQGAREVYKVQTLSGHEIEATDNHPFLTEEGWKQLKELKPKDKVALVSSQPFFGNSTEISEDEGAILGYVSSNSCDSVGCYIATTLPDGDVFLDFKSKMLSLSSNSKIESAMDHSIKTFDDRKYSHVYAQKAVKPPESNLITFIYNNGIKNKSGEQKFVPHRIFVAPKNVVAAYLRSLFSCNAVLHISKLSRFTCKIEASFQSISLTKQVQHLLSRFGIFSSFQSKLVNNKLEHILTINKNACVKLFLEEIGLIGYNDEIKDVIQSVDGKDSSVRVFSPIVSIKKIGTRRTFDIQVSDKPSLQNFVSNGFICHNSGKDFITSIVALYEAMRLLECPGGNPYQMYNLGMAVPFTILTIANSSRQAKILFREIKEKVLNSEYFADKIIPEGITADAIHFLTPEDKKRNEELISKGFAPNPGSIVVMSGHSNSDTLVGISCYVLLLDEIGLYKNTAGSSSGDAIFNSLAPAVKTYVRELPKKDKAGNIIIGQDGKPETEKVYDGKIICLSTPRGKEGVFFDLYNTHMETAHRLVCKAATWQVNPMQSKEGLMAAFPDMPEDKFRMEFGAEFSGTAGENFFPEEVVDQCFAEKTLKFRDHGSPGIFYYAHLDPASSSHNYALVVAHKEVFFNPETMKKDWRIVVDHIKYWTPMPGKPLSVEEIDEYVAELNSRFCFGVVTYDHFNSQVSINKLRKRGVPTKMTPFSKQYKNIIYDNLYQIAVQGKLYIPNHLLLKNEMKNLQRKWLDAGYKVYPKKDGDVTTDDICDALAGACYNCVEKDISKLPQGKLVSLPVQGNNDIVWRSMQGTPYGVGPGQQVARQLERRASWPRRGV
jgi:intein/homing endonuclease